jgi:hypothetical protein
VLLRRSRSFEFDTSNSSLRPKLTTYLTCRSVRSRTGRGILPSGRSEVRDNCVGHGHVRPGHWVDRGGRRYTQSIPSFGEMFSLLWNCSMPKSRQMRLFGGYTVRQSVDAMVKQRSSAAHSDSSGPCDIPVHATPCVVYLMTVCLCDTR